MNTKHYINVLAGLMIAVSVVMEAGCKKLVEAKLPIDKLTAKAVFNDIGGASAALSNIYYTMPTIGASRINGLLADEFVLHDENNEELQAFFSNSLSSRRYTSYWPSCYDLIFRINSIIEGVGSSTGISNIAKNELIGQAKFLRAFVYFQLVNFYGGIPIVTSTDYKINMLLPRSEVSTVYSQIIADLTVAQNLVSENYLKSNLVSVTTERVSVNKAVVGALLARVFLYTGQWAKAEEESTKIINNATYSILDSLDEVFLMNSNETIWQIEGDISKGNNSQDGSFFIPYAAGIIPTVYLSENLLNTFDSHDKRFKNWIAVLAVGSDKFYYPYKYKKRDGIAGSGDVTTEYNMILRLAEQYLIRAEARAHLDNIDGTIEDLNVIRKRAGVELYTDRSPEIILNAIEKERQLEFFAESGHRWFDLKRTGRADEVLATVKGGNWQSTDKLFPIPANEFGLNPSLRGHQNPGYTEN